MRLFKILLILAIPLNVFGNIDLTIDTIPKKEEAPKAEKKSNWYDKISLRGYAQIRYNRLLETNPDLKCEQCDKSWGDNQSFFIRRARLIFSGNVSDRVYIYIQPDLASSASSTGLHFAQLRDAYFDLALDSLKEFRFRIGQSKIPFGFENLQSSQNRLPLDRHDALNSAVANERDLGIFFYWAPDKIRKRFSTLVSSGLKGSGDYGVFGLGAYIGQTANKPELNDDPTYAARLTYPFELPNGQFIESSIQGYTGRWMMASDQITEVSKGKFTTSSTKSFADERVAGSLIIYPQPIGFAVEYNIGRGPEFDPATKTVETRSLKGGYALINYMLKFNKQIVFPFARVHYYDGGKKHELDARKYLVKETELGIEWQPIPNFELVTMYTISDRTFEDAKKPVNRQHGNLLRVQMQFNF